MSVGLSVGITYLSDNLPLKKGERGFLARRIIVE